MKGWPWLFLGVLVGLIHFLLLWWTVSHLYPGAGRRAWMWSAMTSALRLILVAGLLVLAVRRGAMEVLLAFFGFWLTRWPLLYWWSQRPEPPGGRS
jgi:hypothetical protein